ncbi:MAG: hypothetical protein ACREUK_02880 [Burkholderiales bacterium]
MKPAALIALVVALAAPGAASAQGVGLRVGAHGDSSWAIAPALSARVGYPALDLGAAFNGSIYTMNGTSYRASELASMSGMVDPGNRIAPYLGIGYRDAAGAGMNFYFDLGVIYHGSLNASLFAGCGGLMSASQCGQFQADVTPYKYYPVGRIGVSFGF